MDVAVGRARRPVLDRQSRRFVVLEWGDKEAVGQWVTAQLRCVSCRSHRILGIGPIGPGAPYEDPTEPMFYAAVLHVH